MTAPTGAIYPHLIAAVYGRPWVIHADTMNVILEVMDMRAGGVKFTAAEIEERLQAAAQTHGPRQARRTSKQVGIIPIYGTITPRGGMLAQSSGGTSVEAIRRDFRAMLADDDIDAIAFDVDSPGGVVDGIPELAAEIRNARGQKPMTPVANSMMASGALWLAAGADRIVATPSGAVGSIGVIAAHHDRSAKHAKDGVNTTLITSSPYKGEGNDLGPLSEEAIAHRQAEVNAIDDMFSTDVALGRGVDVEHVRANYGQGRTLLAQKAAEVGLIDGIQTLDAAVQDLGRGLVSAGTAPVAARADHTHSLPYAAGDLSQELVYDVVMEGDDVVSLVQQTAGLGTDLPFSIRLALVTAELEEVAGIARDRAARRGAEGRPLSGATLEHLNRVKALLAELETAKAEEPGPRRVASVVDLMLKLKEYEQ